MEALAEAGLRWIEVGSFVRPDRVPRMADTEEVFRRLRPREGITYLALVPNLRGLERAGACGVQAVAVFTAATDTFAQATLGVTIQDSLRTFREVVRRAHEEGMRVRMEVTTVDVSAGGWEAAPSRPEPSETGLRRKGSCASCTGWESRPGWIWSGCG